VIAGKEYGTGSSRDWAAKGTFLLGVGFVLAESYERIHRSNLVGMGVLPLQYLDGETAATHGLTGEETFAVALDDQLKPRQRLSVAVTAKNGSTRTFAVQCRIDTPVEVDYYRNGGILQTVLRKLLAEGGGRPAKSVSAAGGRNGAATAAAKTSKTAAPAPAKKTPAKRTAAKRTAPKPAATRKASARKPAPKKPAGKKPAPKKPQAKRAAAKPKSKPRGRR